MEYTIAKDRRSLTRRGVLWLGLKCDIKCKFCYDENVDKKDKLWLPLDDAKHALEKFRFYYENEYVDFMGGEPTLHPRVFEIVGFCASIGLRPTLITHGMHLADRKRAEAFKAAGVHDFLMSIHGIGENVARLHGRDVENFDRQVQAIDNLNALEIPIRFNCILIRDNLCDLSAIVELAKSKNVKIINFLTFNPYFEWRSAPEIPFQARHSEIMQYLGPALRLCNEYRIEANVRYMPICQLKGFESHAFTGYQLPYDVHEWDYNSWYDRGLNGQPSHEWYYSASAEQKARHSYIHTEKCQNCAARNICDGFHAQYLARWGAEEAVPYSGELISDPIFYIKQQAKHEYAKGSAPFPARAVEFGPLANITQFNGTDENRAGVRVNLPATRRK
ncbi:radical SAM protein [Trinickia fusca]|uniref:Radical SAM protein n=1 Tax=Trinickia fusca TaxID=2419777 RepID=A0A494XFJ3_9BURK|nr:radical SAM protein [Trinickia fusca]RKP48441.1 radical SAM protein [Trinickia fusca]